MAADPTSKQSFAQRHCKAGGDRATRSLNLPVLQMDDHRPLGDRIRLSRNGPRRAKVLIAIQLLIIAHIALWLLGKKHGWFGGKTLSPIEPSEAMQTLELGYINAGFVFFALALLSTLIFGRFVCGWACHMVALQDFCAWLMKKAGVRPKPFRSRLLIWVPFILALYMFVWPSFKRLAVFPLLSSVWPDALLWLDPVPQWQGFSNHLISEHYWTNPEARVAFPIIMIVPSLLIVGFATVYFLGAKGFCTYGCPYGGFFAPLDEFALGRIRVDPDKCHQCGHCTAVCTSNVRVHEEVREYGMVVDPGCMKCMDCVSVCPNDALSFGFGRPAITKGAPKKKRPKKTYDLSRGEDIAVALVFLVSFFCVRGLYLWEGVGLLLSITIAGVFSFLMFTAWRLLSKKRELVSIQNLKLKWRSRIRPAGWVFLTITVVLAAILVQSGIVNWSKWRGGATIAKAGLAYAQAPTSVERPDGVIAQATTAIAHLTRASAVSEGGIALMTAPDLWPKLASMYGARGEFDRATEYYRRFAEKVGQGDAVSASLANLMNLDGRSDDAMQYALEIYEAHPDFGQVLDQIVFMITGRDGFSEAIAFTRVRLEERPEDVVVIRTLVELFLNDAQFSEAIELADRGLALDPGEPRLYAGKAGALFLAGRFPDARRTLEIALGRFPRHPGLHSQLAGVLTLLGEDELAQQHNALALDYSRRP